jgi:hypothetical protein
MPGSALKSALAELMSTKAAEVAFVTAVEDRATAVEQDDREFYAEYQFDTPISARDIRNPTIGPWWVPEAAANPLPVTARQM